MSVQTVLIVDDDSGIRRLMLRVLERRDIHVITADGAAAAEKLLVRGHVDLILCDHEMSGEKGLSFLGRIGGQYPDLIRTLVTGNTDIGLALESTKDPRVHYCITKPFELGEIQDFVKTALARCDVRLQTPQPAASRQHGNSELVEDITRPIGTQEVSSC